MAITTPRDMLRLEIGDTDAATPLFSDEELDYFLTQRADVVLLAAADACEALARRFARDFDFETDNQSFKQSQRVKAYRDMAADLRARASGLTSVGTIRVDGWSQDVDSRAVLSSGESGRRRFYGGRDARPT